MYASLPFSACVLCAKHGLVALSENVCGVIVSRHKVGIYAVSETRASRQTSLKQTSLPSPLSNTHYSVFSLARTDSHRTIVDHSNSNIVDHSNSNIVDDHSKSNIATVIC